MNEHFNGSCLILTSQEMDKLNGWSNMYWGCVGADDDLYKRYFYYYECFTLAK